METYQNYKGYGITYYSMFGTTVIDYNGIEVKRFPRLGESKGLESAKLWIDEAVGA
jgi:hypothetical protein